MKNYEELRISSDGSLLPMKILCFKELPTKDNKSFIFESNNIRYIKLSIIAYIIIFTILHMP